jgi:hypothetical protein
MNDAMEPRIPPSCARRYSPKTVLASGGYGVVWVAEQVELSRPVALKLLMGAAMESEEAVARFKAEARLTASFSHPHIVEVVDHDVEDGVPWIAYELLGGPSLRAHLAGGALSASEAVQIAAQVAGALEHVHAQGVLHRDIKPENVLASAPGHWKVTDFGIAKWSGRDSVKTATGVLIGTPAYIAPEQVQGQPPTSATDMYALGIMLFEMVTGAPPFENDNPILVLEKHLKSPVPRAPGVPQAVQDVIATALAKQPEQRFASMAAMRSALEACGGEGTGERPRGAGGGPRSRATTVRVRPSVAVAVPAVGPRGKGHLAVAAGVFGAVVLIALSAGRAREVVPEPSVAPVPVASARATASPSPTPVPSPSPSPSARARPTYRNVLGERDNVAMAYDPVRERVILFGGVKDDGVITAGERDTWEWDGREWSEVRVDRKSCPTFRFRHAMATDLAGRRVLLSGGRGPMGRLADLWTYDGAGWIQLGPFEGPVGRANLSIVWDSARAELVLFGSEQPDERTWMWNGRAWRSVAAGGPAAHDSVVATYDEHRKRIVAYGGLAPGPAKFNQDTWEWDGRAWSLVKTAMPPTEASSGGRLAYDPVRRRVLMFGGPAKGDLWEYDGVTWAVRKATPSPPSRYDHGMAWDLKRGVLVVYGGSPLVGDGRLGDTWEWDGAAWRQAR